MTRYLTIILCILSVMSWWIISEAVQPSTLGDRFTDGKQICLQVGYDGTNYQIINTTSSGDLRMNLSDGTNDLTFSVHESQVTIPINQIEVDNYTSSISAEGVGATTAYMSIDLDDSGSTFPHSPATDHVDIHWIDTSINPDNSFTGDIIVGFLTNVVSGDGTLNTIREFHMDKNQSQISHHSEYFPTVIEASASTHIGEQQILSAFGNSGTILGPDGGNYTPANGDLVLYLTRTAGTTDFNIAVGYTVQ